MRTPPNKHWVFYAFNGLTLKTKGNLFTAECPIGGCSSDHFSVKRDTGQYSCYKCGSGNHYSFLNWLYHESLAATTDEQYEELAQHRNLKAATLKWAGLARSILLPETWLIPCEKEGKLVNLYRVQYEKVNSTTDQRGSEISRITGRVGNHPPKKRSDRDLRRLEVRSCPDPCHQQLWGRKVELEDTIIICEGHWDRLALIEMLACLKWPKFNTSPADFSRVICEAEPIGFGIPNFDNPAMKRVSIFAKPGNLVWKSEWCSMLTNKHVILIDDHDVDKVWCKPCRTNRVEGAKPHPVGQNCPLCGSNETTGTILNPGRDGQAKVLKEIDDMQISLNSLLVMKWQKDDPKDPRDLLTFTMKS